jgi:hypothetical protein
MDTHIWGNEERTQTGGREGEGGAKRTIESAGGERD